MKWPTRKASAGGAPTNVDYLIGTSNGTLTNEIVVGTTPGGELGNTWASPTVDATHAGGTHLTLGTTPSTQAVGDSAAGGSDTTASKNDHKHAMPAFATNAVVLGTAAAAGNATTLMRSNDTIAAFDATVPTTIASGATAATGSAAVAAHRDHTHGNVNLYIPVTFVKAGACTTGAGVLRWYNYSGRTLTIETVVLALNTAPTGTTSTPVTSATFVVDVNIDGTTIWATQNNRAVIIPATNANLGTFTTFDTTTISTGAHYITCDIDFVGSTIAGSDMTVTVWLKG